MSRGAAAALAAVLAACAADPGGDHLTLEIANWATYTEARLEADVLAHFERAHADVRVVQQSAGTGAAEYRERVLTSIAAGAPPDAFLLDNIDVPSFASRGLLLDLSPYLPKVGVQLDRYQPTVLDIFRRGAAVYAVPKGYTPMVVVYNKDLFDRAGIPYPPDDWTWDGFMDVARRLTRDTDGDGQVDQWGTYFDRRPFLWIPWIWSGGGDVLCPSGRRASGCLDAPATVEAIRWYTGWVTRDSIVPRVHNLRRSLGDNLRLFYTGRVALLTTGHFWVPNFLPYVRDGRLRVGFAVIPHRAGAAPTTVIYASGYAVPAGVPHRRLSVELATFLADSVAQEVRTSERLELPTLMSVAESLAARDTLGWERVFLRAAATGRIPWGSRIEQWREVEAVLPDMMDRITLQGVDPRVAARETAVRLDRLLGGDGAR